MKINTPVKVDLSEFMDGLSKKQALRAIDLADRFQYDCDFTYEAAKLLIERLTNELGQGNSYSEKLMEIL